MKNVKNGLTIFFGIATFGILAMLLLSKPQAVWDNDTPDKLREALYRIELSVANKSAAAQRLALGDFIPRSVDSKVEAPVQNGGLLAKKHGLSAWWCQNPGFEKLLFYPVAVSRKVVIVGRSDSEPTPQIAMVPVDGEDVETLPNLSGCWGVTAEEMCECQSRRMKVLFTKHRVKFAMALMSDGSVRALSIDELCDYVRGTQGEK